MWLLVALNLLWFWDDHKYDTQEECEKARQQVEEAIKKDFPFIFPKFQCSPIMDEPPTDAKS